MSTLEQQAAEVLFWRRPIWDPAPDWIVRDPDLYKRFAELEIQFKVKELEMMQQKVMEMGKIMASKG